MLPNCEAPETIPEEGAESARKSSLAEWRAHSCRARTKVGASAGYSGWTDRPEVVLHGVPHNPRVIDALNLAWATRLKEFETQPLDSCSA